MVMTLTPLCCILIWYRHRSRRSHCNPEQSHIISWHRRLCEETVSCSNSKHAHFVCVYIININYRKYGIYERIGNCVIIAVIRWSAIWHSVKEYVCCTMIPIVCDQLDTMTCVSAMIVSEMFKVKFLNNLHFCDRISYWLESLSELVSTGAIRQHDQVNVEFVK